MKNLTPFVLLWLFFTSCSGDDNPNSPQVPTNMYFPPTSSNTWETQSSNSLGWNQAAIGPLKDFLTQKNSKSFMILVNGRIVMEEYFNGHNATTSWEWNSAGKTLVSATTGIAQQENLLDITMPVSNYLGNSWTAMPSEKERLIKVTDLLSMTSGNDDTKQFVIKSNITYVADAGTRWAYSNVFQKLFDVVTSASKQNFETYFNSKLKNKIGMDGFWNYGTIFTVYHSTTRSMA
ncbi:MAG: serine hydrolase, partial [Flavobacterium sp.]